MTSLLRATYEDIIKVPTLEQSWQLVLKSLTEFGLSEGMVVWFSRGIDQPTKFDYLCNYSGRFLDDYLSIGGGANDPCVQVPVRYKNESSFSSPLKSWKEIDHWLSKQPSTQFASTAMEELSEVYKLHCGYTAVFSNTLNSPMLGVGIGGPSLTESEFKTITAPNYGTISTLICLFGALAKCRSHSVATHAICNGEKHVTLTTRETSMVQWLADGHKLQSIADDHLHRSLSTANKDISQLKHKMKVTTIDELVAKALLAGLIR